MLYFSAIIFEDKQKKPEGQCTAKGNIIGWCRKTEECPLKSLTGPNRIPNLCGFIGHDTIICCPLAKGKLTTKL